MFLRVNIFLINLLPIGFFFLNPLVFDCFSLKTHLISVKYQIIPAYMGSVYQKHRWIDR